MYFFKNLFEKFQNDFSNFETPSLAVSKFRNAWKKKCFQKIPKRLEKKPVFKFSKRIFFVFKVQNNFYSFSSCFQYENEKILFSPKFCFQNLIVFKVQNDFYSFSSHFQYETPKFCFQNLIVFKFFKTIFSVFQPFYEIPKRLEKQFCSRFKIQNAYQNA